MPAIRFARVWVGLPLGLSSSLGWAQPDSAKPIHMILPFAAGGSTDMMRRLIAQKLIEQWGQPEITTSTQDEFAQFIDHELVRFASVITDSNTKID